jgi:hypothetical protein
VFSKEKRQGGNTVDNYVPFKKINVVGAILPLLKKFF